MEDKYGEIEEMNICDNIGEHMIGNVYIKFRREEDAERAEAALNDRWFGGEPVYAELSPVTDFREACCRQYEMGECTRGGFCNFMHLRPISYELRRELFNRQHPWRDEVFRPPSASVSDDVGLDLTPMASHTKRRRPDNDKSRKNSTSSGASSACVRRRLPKAYEIGTSDTDDSFEKGSRRTYEETNKKQNKRIREEDGLPAAFRSDRFGGSPVTISSDSDSSSSLSSSNSSSPDSRRSFLASSIGSVFDGGH